MAGGAGLEILIVGAGVFGRLAAREAQLRGHVPRLASRHHTRRVDADDASSVHAALADVDAVLLTCGPFQERSTAAAQAARDAGVPYADMSDDAGFSARVARLGPGAPLLTGMSTAPAVAEALAAQVMRRAPHADRARAAMLTGAGNRQGPATARYAAHAHLGGAAEEVAFSAGRHRAWPARTHFDPPGLDGRFLVAPRGIAALGWRLIPVLGPLLPHLTRLPRLSRDTSVELVLDLLRGGRVVAGTGLRADAGGQRMAVLPAIWALEAAVRGDAVPRRGALPREWVDPDALVACLQAAGFRRSDR